MRVSQDIPTNVGLLPMQKQRHRSAYCEADQRLCLRYTDSTIPLLLKSKISSFKPFSVAVQTDLCRTWSETPKTRFSCSAAHIIHKSKRYALDLNKTVDFCNFIV